MLSGWLPAACLWPRGAAQDVGVQFADPGGLVVLAGECAAKRRDCSDGTVELEQ